MTSLVPRLTLSSVDGTESASLRLSDSPRLEAHRPSDLKLHPLNLEQSDDEQDFTRREQPSCPHLKIPSPTYRIMFTPEFLIRSYDDSVDDYSDRLSSDEDEIDRANATLMQDILPPWSSRAEHIKPVIDHLINEETRQQNSVRLAWRSALAASPSETYGSWPTSSDVQPGLDSVDDTQSTFWLSCDGIARNSICATGTDELGSSSLRRTKSLADLSTKRVGVPKNKYLSSLGSFCNFASVHARINKENHIKHWVSAVAVTH